MPREKRLFSLPLYVSWVLSVLGLFRLSGSARNPAYEAVRNAWHGPPLPAWVTVLGLAALCASFAGVVVVARRRRARGAPLPWPSYAVLSAQVLWFTAGLFNPFFNITLVPMFHSLQYLALTSWHACHGRGDGGAAAVRRLRGHHPGASASRSTRGCSRSSATRGRPARSSSSRRRSTSFVNLHHFLLDGRIWRLRERRVVQAMVAMTRGVRGSRSSSSWSGCCSARSPPPPASCPRSRTPSGTCAPGEEIWADLARAARRALLVHGGGAGLAQPRMALAGGLVRAGPAGGNAASDASPAPRSPSGRSRSSTG